MLYSLPVGRLSVWITKFVSLMVPETPLVNLLPVANSKECNTLPSFCSAASVTTCQLSEKSQIQIAPSLCHKEILSKTDICEKEFDWNTREKVNAK